MKRLLAFLALSASATAWSAEWTAVPAPRSADKYYYDASKLVVENEEVTYWKKVLFRTPQPFKGQQAATALYRERLHCGQHTVKTLSYLLQTREGGTLEYTDSKDAGASPVIPDSVGDLFEQSLCALLKQRQEDARRKAETELQAAKTKAEATPAAPSAPIAKPTPPAPPAKPVEPAAAPTPAPKPAEKTP